MLLQARKLDLLPKTLTPFPSSSSSSQIVSSLLFEPSSHSLALMLSDSSLLLYPSLSPFIPNPSAPAPTPIPPVSTAFCFVRLVLDSNPARVLFLAASPQSSTTLLRAWILNNDDVFIPARLSFKRDLGRSAIALGLRHGISVRLAGTVNVFVLHSLAANQIWVMAARVAEAQEGVEGVSVRLTRCAVIDCTLPIYSLELSMGCLLLGEVGGVRVFPLRPLIKGRALKRRQKGLIDSCKKTFSKGGLCSAASGEPPRPRARCCVGGVGGFGEGRTGADYAAPCRLRTAKLTQNSGDHCSFFVEMRGAEVQNSESSMSTLASVKAVTIHELSQKTFLILDSVGDVHLLNLHNTVKAVEAPCHSLITSKDARINHLSYTMKVQILAVLPDIATRTQAIWISDGGYSVHMILVADKESPVNESDKKDGTNENAIEISAIQAIFTSDKVQDIVPLSANAVLILGEGNPCHACLELLVYTYDAVSYQFICQDMHS